MIIRNVWFWYRFALHSKILIEQSQYILRLEWYWNWDKVGETKTKTRLAGSATLGDSSLARLTTELIRCLTNRWEGVTPHIPGSK